MKRVAILGCGPAGLLAAHAAHLCRVDATVISIANKSEISGAQYLHTAIPDLTSAQPDGAIFIHKWGSAGGYAKKVYGSPTAPCSFDLFQEGEQQAWSLRDAYDALWSLYGDVADMPINHEIAGELINDYDLVLSTVPAKAICGDPNHMFPAQSVWFTDKAVYEGNWESFICYSGSPEEQWYRTSSIFGVGQTEWPAGAEVPLGGDAVRMGWKPLNTNCNCHPRIRRIGRFGKWHKGVLTHHAFQEAMHALQQL